MNAWKNIFEQSRVNNGLYQGDGLPAQNWQWPSGTWFQKRLRYLRKGKGYDGNSLGMNSR
jgi:hypothetical protein